MYYRRRRMIESVEELLLTYFYVLFRKSVLYHQPEKMVRSKEELMERQENLEKLKKQHGID